MQELEDSSIACIDSTTLRKVFNKLNVGELVHLSKKWGFHNELDNSATEKKRKIVDVLVKDKFIEGLTHKQVAEVDLIYYQLREVSRRWSVLQLVSLPNPADVPQAKGAIDVTMLKSAISRELCSFIKQHTCVVEYKSNIWIRISVHDGVPSNTLPPSLNNCYMVYFPHAQYVFCSSIKKEYEEVVRHALLSALQCEEAIDVPMQGRQLDSLAELLLYPKSQGRYFEYRNGSGSKDDDHVLARKRKRDKGEKTTKSPKNGIIEEDSATQDKMDKSVKRVFGSHVQPATDSLVLRISGQYRGTPELKFQPKPKPKPTPKETTSDSNPATETEQQEAEGEEYTPIIGNVKFTGSNILEGLRQLAARGYVTNGKLPSIITTEMYKTNTIHIDDL